MDPFWREVTTIGAAIFILAIFTLVQAALVSMDTVRLRQLIDGGNRTAMLIERMVAHPEDLLTGLVVAISTLVLLVANLTTRLAASYLATHWTVVVIFSVLLLLLVVGEIIPRTISIHFVEGIALRTARVAYVLNLLLRPVVVVLTWISGGLLRLFIVTRLLPGRVNAVPTAFTPEDIKQLLTIGELGGEVAASEREMISGVIEFAETTAGEIMVPRTELVSLPVETELEEAISVFLDSGHSRIPVYEENADNILGILYIKDMLINLKTARDAGTSLPVIRDLLRPASFVPESKKSDELLREMQRQRVHLAIVVDEYGGTAGLITIEDLLEEIVGDIIDEYDTERQDIVTTPDGAALIFGGTSLDKVHDTLDMPLPETEADTISGLVMESLGHIPQVGDRAVISGVEFIVLEARQNRAELLRATILRDDEHTSPE
ncbi:MAG: Magnesium and cobalt efflux protein CorC [bacterium ADurb.Bin429]|nr:MAG: Magnesium and cobalt efflux protein CorC [bacterium ADurb.Bin429]